MGSTNPCQDRYEWIYIWLSHQIFWEDSSGAQLHSDLKTTPDHGTDDEDDCYDDDYNLILYEKRIQIPVCILSRLKILAQILPTFKNITFFE